MSELDDFRRAKDDFFAHDPQSPLTATQRSGFAGLRYFDENPAFALDVEPEILDPQERVELETSTSDTAVYVRWARVRFSVDGRAAALVVYREAERGDLFVPFRDATSGDESYGAGRYLEPLPEPGGTLRLDFNYAYNPYCAYNDAWSCPLPPEENRLAVPIRAGERSFHS